jgi:PmbA protein
MDYHEIAEKALRLAGKMGSDETEVYISSGTSTSSDIRRNAVESAYEKHHLGVGIRCVVRGAVGFASTNVFDDLENTVRNAIDSARIRPADPEWPGLPSVHDYPEVKGLFSGKVNGMSLEECIASTMQMVEGVSSVKGVLATSGSFSRSTDSYLIMNSNGVDIGEKSTSISGFVDVITTGEDIATAYDFDMSRDLDIDFYGIGLKAATLAADSRAGIEIEGGKKDIVFHPFALSDLIQNAFIPSIDADNIQKGRSSLAGKTGELIAAESLSITDDGTLKGGSGSSVSDDEGFPSRKTPVISNGVLDSYLYDSYTAGKAGVESTGNATRGSYASLPGIGTTNLVFSHPPSDIISKIDDGVFINTVIGAHTANHISGDFSVEARNAFVIKHGEIEAPVNSLMVSGNIFELLSGIRGAGKDVRKVGGIILPSIWAADMNLVG